MLSSSRGNKRKDFVNRVCNAAINTKRCAVLKTRREEVTRANFVAQPLRLKLCKGLLKPIACSPSKKGWVSSVSRFICVHSMVAKLFAPESVQPARCRRDATDLPPCARLICVYCAMELRCLLYVFRDLQNKRKRLDVIEAESTVQTATKHVQVRLTSSNAVKRTIDRSAPDDTTPYALTSGSDEKCASGRSQHRMRVSS
jgi:hypothetical protein